MCPLCVCVYITAIIPSEKKQLRSVCVLCVVCERMEKNGKESVKTVVEIPGPTANAEEPEKIKYRGIKAMPFIIGKIQSPKKNFFFSFL